MKTTELTTTENYDISSSYNNNDETNTTNNETESAGLVYDSNSNLYYDSSTSPINYYHWNPKYEEYMLVVVPEKYIDEWSYWKQEEAGDVDVSALVEHTKKKKKKISNKRKKEKEEKFLAKKAKEEQYLLCLLFIYFI